MFMNCFAVDIYNSVVLRLRDDYGAILKQAVEDVLKTSLYQRFLYRTNCIYNITYSFTDTVLQLQKNLSLKMLVN